MELKNIAQIRTGVVLNRKKGDEKTGISNKLLTLSSLSNEGLINKEQLETFYSSEELGKEYFTKEGDIIVRLRQPIISSYITKENTGILVPAYFAIIRVKNQNFLSQYIATVINQEKVQRELVKDVSQTAVSIIKTQSLGEIEIKKQSLKEQEKIGRIAELYIKEMDLLKKLEEKKKELYKGLFQKLI